MTPPIYRPLHHDTVSAFYHRDPNHNLPVTVQEIQQIDTDHNRQISAAEARTAGINPADISRINQAYAAHANAPNLVVFNTQRMESDYSMSGLLNVFDRVDADNNGHLSRHELRSAMRQNRFTGWDAAAIAALHQEVDALEGLHDDELGPENDGITRQDITALRHHREESHQIFSMINSGLNRIHATPETLAPQGVSSIRPDHVQQGMLGDCYYLAALASQSNTPEGRQAILDMIHENNNGTYTVSFPNREPVTVTAPTDSEIASYATAGPDGRWLSILEKAYAQSENSQNILPHANNYDEIPGGTGHDGISALTTHSTDSDILSMTRLDTTRHKLTDALSHGRMVTAGISGFPYHMDPQLDNGLPTGHQYTILSYDRNSDQITLRNPWGHQEPMENGHAADGTDDGRFTMSLEEFQRRFSTITYEEAH